MCIPWTVLLFHLESFLFQDVSGVEEVIKQNYKDRLDFCIFCDKDVGHFARHMYTWHESEFEVQRILSFKTKSAERRKALCELKKKGNFIRNKISDVKLRPVKRTKSNVDTKDDFLPCAHCLGFYKKKGLYRHTKRCSPNILGKRQTSQSDGQTTLSLNSRHRHQTFLKTVLFSRMKADEISLIAKSDPLICNYGYSYLKGRRSKGNFDLVKQNMRRLAKLLKYAKDQNKNIKEMIDLLKPSFFEELIVPGVNQIARFNSETEEYESPTLALNFGTLIKKCCDLAYIILLQKNNSEMRRKEIKILKTLIESQWANEVSAQAALDLNKRKWNKKELVPLTSDLKIMHTYLVDTAKNSYRSLIQNDADVASYTILKEVLYCQIILLNRRRPAEVAQLRVETYKSVDLETNDERREFQHCLTETEKVLLNTYSRFVIRGKRGRGVPVILSPDMKKQFDLLINSRNKFVEENPYIFHSSGNGFIDGTKTLYKHAKKCGAECPKSITATRLRKHLATITQLLQFSESDLEQLSKFMGHTLKTHFNFYRLSDDIYQTAKVSKLLLLMREGGAERFKNKRLDEIHIDLDPISEENDTENINSEFNEVEECDENTPKISEYALHELKMQKKVKKGVEKRKNWSKEQKKLINEYFREKIIAKQPPKKSEIETFIELHPEFTSVKWSTLKAVVYNIYSNKLKIP